jgi:hypothetical protein
LLNNIFKFLFQFAIILIYKAFNYKFSSFFLIFLPPFRGAGGPTSGALNTFLVS